MSDQVVFTEEEVEKIKKALAENVSDLERVAPDCEILPETREALSLLDSPRPRPKVSRELYTSLSIWIQGGTYKVDEILNEYGFDVED
jgi:hypothetical protein